MFYAKDCNEMECLSCQDTKQRITNNFSHILTGEHQNALIKWEEWERYAMKVNMRKNGQLVVEEREKMVLNEKQGTIKETVNMLIKA